MAEKSVYEQIKKQNGEAFAKAIRTFDNGIFEVPDIVKIVRFAGRDAGPLLSYLESLKDVKIVEKTEQRDPIELLNQAGYDAYYADTLEKQNEIEKYYASAQELEKMGISSSGSSGEKLCTFRDNNRYKNYYIINAVRKDVENIKREDFIGKEKREDEYGTSVLSIQIAKKGGFISIKNRYNHTIENPDNTFHSNPDNIIFGLSSALKKHFHVDFSTQKRNVELGDYYALFGNQIVHYDEEKDNIYYGPDFFVKNGVIYPIDKDKEIMLDHWILNIKDKTMLHPKYMDPFPLEDERNNNENTVAYDMFTAMRIEFRGKKLRIAKNKEGGHDVLANGVPIVTSENGHITALNLQTVTKIELCLFDIPNYFLKDNRTLKSFTAAKLKEIDGHFLEKNEVLETFNAPNLEDISYEFLSRNKALRKLDLPSLKRVGWYFLNGNEVLESFNAPNLREVDYRFLSANKALRRLDLPSLEEVGYDFLSNNRKLLILNAPKLEKIGQDFLSSNWIYGSNAPALSHLRLGMMKGILCLLELRDRLNKKRQQKALQAPQQTNSQLLIKDKLQGRE